MRIQLEPSLEASRLASAGFLRQGRGLPTWYGNSSCRRLGGRRTRHPNDLRPMARESRATELHYCFKRVAWTEVRQEHSRSASSGGFHFDAAAGMFQVGDAACLAYLNSRRCASPDGLNPTLNFHSEDCEAALCSRPNREELRGLARRVVDLRSDWDSQRRSWTSAIPCSCSGGHCRALRAASRNRPG